MTGLIDEKPYTIEVLNQRWMGYWARNGGLYTIYAMHDDGRTRTPIISIDELSDVENHAIANHIVELHNKDIGR